MHAYRTMYRAMLGTIALAAFAVIAGALALILAAGGAQASTVTHTATVTPAHPSTATPARAACTAFARWQQHQDTARLARLVIASLQLGRSDLKATIAQLYSDESSLSPGVKKYISDDSQRIFQDCHNGYGL